MRFDEQKTIEVNVDVPKEPVAQEIISGVAVAIVVALILSWIGKKK